MEDLSPEHIALLRQMTPTQKVNAVNSLYQTARMLKKSRFKELEPALTEEELEKKVSRYFLHAST